MKIFDAFKVTTTRPMWDINSVSIAELAQFTDFQLHDLPFSAAWQALVSDWKFEYICHDDEYQTMSSLKMFFKDGSTLKLELK